MTKSYVERERKFEVDPAFVIPDVASVLPRGGRSVLSTERLQSEYFDTADLALLRAGVVLRRRTGTIDSGWQLKVPDGEFREEIRLDDSSGGGVPDELDGLLLGVRRGQALRPIATIATERTSTQLVAADGRILAEIDDDVVHGAAAGEVATLTSWREVEVELGEADLTMLCSLAKRLRHAGARRSGASSKLSRVMGAPENDRVTGVTSHAGRVLTDYLVTQHHQIVLGDLALRRGNESVIHNVRVATRRLRSTLRVFGQILESEPATHLDAELRWYAGLLGEVRDRQVLRRRLDRLAAEIDEPLSMGPVRARIDSELGGEHTEHWQRLLVALDSQRYLDLLADLDAWLQSPVPRSGRLTKRAVSRATHRAQTKVSKRLKTAISSGDRGQFHRARKATKRARYATEVTREIHAKKAAKRRVNRYRDLQDLLGEHQDAIVSADVIRRLGAAAGATAGENGFAFGILHEREQQNASAARAQARQVAKRYR